MFGFLRKSRLQSMYNGLVFSSGIDQQHIKALEEKVNAYLEKGWKLQGGVSVHLSSSNTYCYQAMTFSA